MAQLLQYQSSSGVSEKGHLGCLWGLVEYFSHHHLLQSKKSLPDSKPGDAGQAGSMKDSRLYIPLNSNQHNKSYGEANSKAAKGNSGKTLRDVILKKMFRKLQRKQKMLPVTTHLLRTFSIHHLECNDYVLPEEQENTWSQTEALESQEAYSYQTGEHVPLLDKDIQCEDCEAKNCAKHASQDQFDELIHHLTEKQLLCMEKLHAAREAFLRQKKLVSNENGTDDTFQSKDFIKMLELFNTHRHLFLKILEDPNCVLESNSEGLDSTNKIINKSGSFPSLGSPRHSQSSQVKHKKIARDHLVNREMKSLGETSVSTFMHSNLHAIPSDAGIVDMVKSEPPVSDIYNSDFTVTSREIEHQMRRGTNLNCLIDETPENWKENLRISMDGLLHKIPYGQKLPEQTAAKKLFRSASARSSDDVSNDNMRATPKVYQRQTILRSRSLTESLDQYSNLLNSITIRGSQRLPELNSVKEYCSSQDKKTPKSFERIYSNPEFESYPSCRGIQNGPFHAFLSLKETSITNKDMGATGDMYVISEPKLNERERPVDVAVKMIGDEFTEQFTHASSTYTTDKQCFGKINETEQSETCMATNSSGEHGSHIQLPQHDSEALVCFNQEMERLSNYVISEGSESSSFNLEDTDYLPKPLNSLNIDVSATVETIKTSFSSEHTDVLNNAEAFRIKLDQKDEADFNYVRDLLMDSSFDSSAFVRAWYSHNGQVEPFIFGHVNQRFHELETASHGSNETSLDHQLLSDLVNEVLFEIYEKSFLYSWFLRIHPSVRPIPVGHHVLEEVWIGISSLLSSQRQPIHTLVSVIARDFAKNEGWLNHQRDAESIGIELECLVLDDLLEELIPELTDS